MNLKLSDAEQNLLLFPQVDQARKNPVLHTIKGSLTIWDKVGCPILAKNGISRKIL